MSDEGARASEEPIRLGRRRSAAPAPQEQAPQEDQHQPADDNHHDDHHAEREFAPPLEDDDGRYERGGWNQPQAEPEVRLPANVEAEAALLGAMMIDNRILERERTVVEPKHFFEPVHGRIMEAMLSLLDRGETANPITLRPLLDGDEALTALGGLGYLAQLTGSGAGLLGAGSFARQIVDLAARRDLYDVFGTCQAKVLDTRDDAGINSAIAMVDDAMSRSMEMDRRQKRSSGVSVQKAWDEAFADMEQSADEGTTRGIKIDQYQDWNDVVGPLGAGDLVYLGGRPSMGKTGVAVKVMMGAAAAMQDEKPEDGELPGAVEFFSLEMSRLPIMQRAIADAIFKPNETSSFDALINGRMTSRDRGLIRQMRAQIADLPLHINDPDSEMMVENFASEVRRRQRAWEKRGRKLKLVIVDYLGRFGTVGKFSGQPDRVTHISRVLKSAAKECGVALVVLAQLSRSLESREDKRPTLADLRDSGSLEQDADVVAFVYRDQYYLERSEPPRSAERKWEAWDIEMAAARDRMELLGAKRRQGALVRRTGYFITDSQAVRSSEWRWGDDLFNFGD